MTARSSLRGERWPLSSELVIRGSFPGVDDKLAGVDAQHGCHLSRRLGPVLGGHAEVADHDIEHAGVR